ncbi:MAG: hypothetical protein IJO68_09040 [Clostridia bacterium]|nr:hypothetical protein [Clostridia bacterium]
MSENTENIDIKKIYSLLVAVRQELSRLSCQVKAMRGQVKGETENGS